MSQKPTTCIVSCSILKRELQQLKAQGNLDSELVFVSKNFHIDYTLIENNMRKVLEYIKKRFKSKIVLVYGVNCVDCQLGGKGKVNTIDPAIT